VDTALSTKEKENWTMSYPFLTPEEEAAQRRRRQEEADARNRRREEFLAELLGPSGVARYAPPPITDFDAQLGEHAAQVAKLARLTMNYALNEDATLEHQISAINAVTRLVQTNISILRALGAKSKTVQGVSADKEPQAVGSPE
jgi:hypothetical protein